MKEKCPRCGYSWEKKAKNQAKGGKARWAGTTKAERSEMMRAVRRKEKA